MDKKAAHPKQREQPADALSFHPLATKYGGNLDEKELDAKSAGMCHVRLRLIVRTVAQHLPS